MFNDPLISFCFSYGFSVYFTFCILVALDGKISTWDTVKASLLCYLVVPILFYLYYDEEIAEVFDFFILEPITRTCKPLVHIMDILTLRSGLN